MSRTHSLSTLVQEQTWVIGDAWWLGIAAPWFLLCCALALGLEPIQIPGWTMAGTAIFFWFMRPRITLRYGDLEVRWLWLPPESIALSSVLEFRVDDVIGWSWAHLPVRVVLLTGSGRKLQAFATARLLKRLRLV